MWPTLTRLNVAYNWGGGGCFGPSYFETGVGEGVKIPPPLVCQWVYQYNPFARSQTPHRLNSFAGPDGSSSVHRVAADCPKQWKRRTWLALTSSSPKSVWARRYGRFLIFGFRDWQNYNFYWFEHIRRILVKPSTEFYQKMFFWRS